MKTEEATWKREAEEAIKMYDAELEECETGECNCNAKLTAMKRVADHQEMPINRRAVMIMAMVLVGGPSCLVHDV